MKNAKNVKLHFLDNKDHHKRVLPSFCGHFTCVRVVGTADVKSFFFTNSGIYLHGVFFNQQRS